MRTLSLFIAFILAAPASAATGTWNFRVLLDDREIGQHRYELQPRGDDMELRSEARFDVRPLFFSAYRYEHESVERWHDGCLQSLRSRTVTNGEQIVVTARESGGNLTVDRPAGRDIHPGCVKSFAYWDPRILEAHALLNSQTGELVPVRVTELGPDAVSVQGQGLRAVRHRISGTGLQIDVWYAGGDWVALEALTDGGRRLRYELAEKAFP